MGNAQARENAGENAGIRPRRREELDEMLDAHLEIRQKLQKDLLDDQQESVTFDVHGANVAQVLEARFQLLEYFREKEATHEGTVNEEPIRTLGLKNAGAEIFSTTECARAGACPS